MLISDWSSDVCSSDEVFDERIGIRLVEYAACFEAFDMADEVTMIDGRRLRCAIAEDALGDVGRKRRPIDFRDEDLERGGVVTDALPVRSEERRVGKECGSTCRSRGTPNH